ncbi:MAG: helix-turn-helix domain-containing protein [Vulcanimicrobiota bacterium]
MESIGERIRHKRNEHGFDLCHYAVALLVTPETIQKIENDEFSDLPRHWLTRIAALNGLETKELIKDTNIHFYDPSRQVYVLRKD